MKMRDERLATSTRVEFYLYVCVNVERRVTLEFPVDTVELVILVRRERYRQRETVSNKQTHTVARTALEHFQLPVCRGTFLEKKKEKKEKNCSSRPPLPSK